MTAETIPLNESNASIKLQKKEYPRDKAFDIYLKTKTCPKCREPTFRYQDLSDGTLIIKCADNIKQRLDEDTFKFFKNPDYCSWKKTLVIQKNE